MINLFISLALLSFNAQAYPFAMDQPPDLNFKWYIRKVDNTASYTVSVDARKLNRYIQLSDMRFIVEYSDQNDRLISRDTLQFLPQTAGVVVSHPITHLSGGNLMSMDYRHQYAANTKVRGTKLLYKWDDSSISLEPDPIEEKVIIPDLVYGEGISAISEAP